MLSQLEQLVARSAQALALEQQVTDVAQRTASIHVSQMETTASNCIVILNLQLHDALSLYHLILLSLYYLSVGDSKNASKLVSQLLVALKK